MICKLVTCIHFFIQSLPPQIARPLLKSHLSGRCASAGTWRCNDFTCGESGWNQQNPSQIWAKYGHDSSKLDGSLRICVRCFSHSVFIDKNLLAKSLGSSEIVPSEATFKRLDLPNSVAGAVYAVGSPMLID